MLFYDSLSARMCLDLHDWLWKLMKKIIEGMEMTTGCYFLFFFYKENMIQLDVGKVEGIRFRNISYPQKCMQLIWAHCYCYEIKVYSSIYPVSFFSFMMQDDVTDDITSGLPLRCSVCPESLMMQHKEWHGNGDEEKTARKRPDQFLFPFPIKIFLDFRWQIEEDF